MVDLFEALIGMGFTIIVGARGEDPLLPNMWVEIRDYNGNSAFFSVNIDGDAIISFTPSTLID